VRGFRARATMSPGDARALARRGYRYDSSIFRARLLRRQGRGDGCARADPPAERRGDDGPARARRAADPYRRRCPPVAAGQAPLVELPVAVTPWRACRRSQLADLAPARCAGGSSPRWRSGGSSTSSSMASTLPTRRRTASRASWSRARRSARADRGQARAARGDPRRARRAVDLVTLGQVAADVQLTE